MELGNGTSTADLANEYWAATDFNEDPNLDGGAPLNDGQRMASELMRKNENYYNYYGSTGLFERDRRSYMSLYGLAPDGDNVSYRITRGGENGQLALFTPNHYGNILNHMATLVAAKKPGLQGRAENSDSDSLQQAKLADAVIDHFQRELDIEGYSRTCLTGCLTMREAWFWMRWNSNKGDVYAPGDGSSEATKTGGFEVSVHQPGDIIRDVTALDIHDPDWLMVRHFTNKWDLAARFPEHREDILACSRNTSDPYRVEFQTTVIESDLIPLYQFYHKPTEALPSGRQCTLVSSKGLLLDGPLAYGGTIPLIPMMPQKLYSTAFGYTPMFELLALQQILNALYSGMVTDAVAFAVRRILVPRGQPITATQLQANLGVLYYDGNMPKPELMETPLNTGEKLAAIQSIEKLFGTLSGINDVVRGNAENTGVKAASGLALLQAQALQYLSFLEFEYGRFWQRWGNLCLAILRERAQAPLMIAVAGKSKQSTLQSFTGNQIPNNYRVTVDLGNPVLKTAAGRQTVADNLMQVNGFGEPGIEATQKYLQFLNTGSLQPTMDAQTAEVDLILSENEQISMGICPPVSLSDTDELHIHDHFVPTYAKEARQGPMDMQMMMPVNPITKAWWQHQQMHMRNQQVKAQLAPPAPMQPGQVPPEAGQQSHMMPKHNQQKPVGGNPHNPTAQTMPSEPVGGIRQAQPAKPPPGSVQQ